MVLIDGLMYKLYQEGMDRKIWRLVRNEYTNFKCAAYIAGVPGEWFVAERGVHQVAPLIIRLYQVFINSLMR